MDLNETQILNDRGDKSDKQKNQVTFSFHLIPFEIIFITKIHAFQVGTLYVGVSEYQIIQGFNRIGRARPCSIVLEDAVS